jgi:hypothetical protein
MYASRWSRDLRQGDLFGPILYPKLKGVPQIVEKPQGWDKSGKTVVGLEFPADERHAVVLSHCCEFREGKRERYLVARVQEFPDRLPIEMRQAMERSNVAVREEEGADERYEHLEVFILDPIEGYFPDNMVVDFTTIMSLPKSIASIIRDSKKAELEHEHRVLLRKKLGMFLARDAPDVKEDRRIEPTWRPDAQGKQELEAISGPQEA